MLHTSLGINPVGKTTEPSLERVVCEKKMLGIVSRISLAVIWRVLPVDDVALTTADADMAGVESSGGVVSEGGV